VLVYSVFFMFVFVYLFFFRIGFFFLGGWGFPVWFFWIGCQNGWWVFLFLFGDGAVDGIVFFFLSGMGKALGSVFVFLGGACGWGGFLLVCLGFRWVFLDVCFCAEGF